MKSQFQKTRFWALFLVAYLILGGVLVYKIDIPVVSILWSIGLIATLIIVFIQVRKTDKVIAKDKEFKRQVSNNLKGILKYFITTEMILFLVFIAYLLILKFFNVDITPLRTIIGFIVITIFYILLHKKGLLGFLGSKK